MANHDDTNSKYLSLPATDLDTFFKSDMRDPRSELPLGVCSLLLRYLLPQLELERYVLHRRIPIEKNQEIINAGLNLRFSLMHVTGSSIEGFSVPPYRDRTPAEVPGEIPGRAGASFYQASDIDSMADVRFLPVEVRPTPGRLYIDEARASHVGYVRLVLDSPTDTYGLSFPVRNICRTVSDGGETVHCLSNEVVIGFLAKVAKDNAEKGDEKVNLSGPAVNLEPKHSGRRGLDLRPSMDIVPALPLIGHPPAFHQWLERVSKRDRHWPSRETVDDIRRHGRCFVVPTGHASSADRDLECRLSFSDPERRLAQTVTPNQRKVYLLVKLLQKCYLKEPKVVVTYHLKTLMFWLLEESQPQDWTEQTTFERVLVFLDKIEGCLERREIPSYFYPSNNLISHAHPNHVAATLAIVRRIRDDPLRHLFGIDERVWMGFSTLAPLSSLRNPVLQVMNGGENGIRLKMANSLMRQARQGTVRDILWPLRCADLLRDTYGVMRDVMSAQLGDETSGTEVSVLWSSCDWLALATIAVFAALRQEESWWIWKVSEGSCELPRVVDNGREENLFMEAAALLLPARPHASFMLKMFLAADRGNSVPLNPKITLKYAMKVTQEGLHTALKRPNISSRFARLFLQVGKAEYEGNASGPENEKATCAFDLRETARSRSTTAGEKAKCASTGVMPGTQHGGARPKDTGQVAQRSETVAPPEPDLPRLTTEAVMPIARLQDAAIAAAASYGGPPPIESTPERLAGSMLFRETYGWSQTLIARLHVQILEIIGCLLRRWPRLACRCALWMHGLTLRFGGWEYESAPSVPLADAPRFLECLPPTSAVLLRRPSARAALLPLSAFVLFTTAALVDEPFRRQVVSMEVREEQLTMFFEVELRLGNGEDCAYDDVVWTNVVMKLCLREMMRQDVRNCLREVGLLRGGDKGQRARQILRRHGL